MLRIVRIRHFDRFRTQTLAFGGQFVAVFELRRADRHEDQVGHDRGLVEPDRVARRGSRPQTRPIQQEGQRNGRRHHQQQLRRRREEGRQQGSARRAEPAFGFGGNPAVRGHPVGRLLHHLPTRAFPDDPKRPRRELEARRLRQDIPDGRNVAKLRISVGIFIAEQFDPSRTPLSQRDEEIRVFHLFFVVVFI